MKFSARIKLPRVPSFYIGRRPNPTAGNAASGSGSGSPPTQPIATPALGPNPMLRNQASAQHPSALRLPPPVRRVAVPVNNLLGHVQIPTVSSLGAVSIMAEAQRNIDSGNARPEPTFAVRTLRGHWHGMGRSTVSPSNGTPEPLTAAPGRRQQGRPGLPSFVPPPGPEDLAGFDRLHPRTQRARHPVLPSPLPPATPSFPTMTALSEELFGQEVECLDIRQGRGRRARPELPSFSQVQEVGGDLASHSSSEDGDGVDLQEDLSATIAPEDRRQRTDGRPTAPPANLPSQTGRLVGDVWQHVSALAEDGAVEALSRTSFAVRAHVHSEQMVRESLQRLEEGSPHGDRALFLLDIGHLRLAAPDRRSGTMRAVLAEMEAWAGDLRNGDFQVLGGPEGVNPSPFDVGHIDVEFARAVLGGLMTVPGPECQRRGEEFFPVLMLLAPQDRLGVLAELVAGLGHGNLTDAGRRRLNILVGTPANGGGIPDRHKFQARTLMETGALPSEVAPAAS